APHPPRRSGKTNNQPSSPPVRRPQSRSVFPIFQLHLHSLQCSWGLLASPAATRMFLISMSKKKQENLHVQRRHPIGAELIGPNQTHFRVWAPKAQRIDLVLDESAAKDSSRTFHELEAEKDGYFSGFASAGRGTRYQFRVNDGENFYPDPASRFQPDGPHGSSCIIDPTQFRWTDSHWPGITLKGQIIYEMHIGTFTKEGTWDAAAQQLEELARIGITVIEMMPVADFPGKFGWGYDGVNLFAPTHLYGAPDDLRRFIDRAHS